MDTSLEELYMIIGSYDVEIYALKKRIGMLENELNKERESAANRLDKQRESSHRLVNFPETTESGEGRIGEVTTTENGPT